MYCKWENPEYTGSVQQGQKALKGQKTKESRGHKTCTAYQPWKTAERINPYTAPKDTRKSFTVHDSKSRKTLAHDHK